MRRVPWSGQEQPLVVEEQTSDRCNRIWGFRTFIYWTYSDRYCIVNSLPSTIVLGDRVPEVLNVEVNPRETTELRNMIRRHSFFLRMNIERCSIRHPRNASSMTDWCSNKYQNEMNAYLYRALPKSSAQFDFDNHYKGQSHTNQTSIPNLKYRLLIWIWDHCADCSF